MTAKNKGNDHSAQAELHGSGAIAQGEGAVAAGAGGIAIGGNVGRAVQVVIEELTLQRAPPPPVGPRPEDLRERYLTDLAREANRLPWAVVEQEYAHPERGEALGLAEVYTALDTTELERVEREEELRRFLAQVARDEARRIPAQAMVNQEARLVILGDPGSGKSTFVKHLTYTLAQAGLADDAERWLERMAPWGHGLRLPVRVELRALAAYAEEEGKEGRQLLLGYLHHHLREEELDDFWPMLNEAIRDEDEVLLFLLDGLDEAPAGLRGRIVDAVQDFAYHYRQHRYVATCRPYAYVGQPCRLQRFREVTLAPFSEEQIDHFVETWYRQLARRGRLSSRKAEKQAGQMQRAVRRGDLRGLAQRPLLLTVMTLLHTFRGQLPQDRTELYADAVDLLLRRWEGRIGEEEGILERLDIPGLKMSDLEAGLYNVAFRAHAMAFHAHSEGGEEGGDGAATADVEESDLRKWLAPYLGGAWDNFGGIRDYLAEYEDDKMTAEAKQLYEVLLEHGPLDKVRLRREARLTSDSAKSRVDRALVELQVGLKVLPVGVTEAGAWNYAFVYELFQRWFPEVPEQARPIGRAEARRVLVQRYLDNVVAADHKMIAKVFHVLKWTSKELERTIAALLEEEVIQKVEIEKEGELLVSTRVLGCECGSV